MNGCRKRSSRSIVEEWGCLSTATCLSPKDGKGRRPEANGGYSSVGNLLQPSLSVKCACTQGTQNRFRSSLRLDRGLAVQCRLSVLRNKAAQVDRVTLRSNNLGHTTVAVIRHASQRDQKKIIGKGDKQALNP